MTLLYGGAFDPPHNGHVELAREAEARFGSPLVVLVTGNPGHRGVTASAEDRLELARAAFPSRRVELDPHRFTIDLLRAGSWPDPVVVLGADELIDFPRWREPRAVLALARLAVATRPGYPVERVEEALARLGRERIDLFEMPAVPVSSTEVRSRLLRGEPIADAVPPAVARLIRKRGLYRCDGRLSAPDEDSSRH